MTRASDRFRASLSAEPSRAASTRRALWAALGITLALYVVPFGRLLLWPVTLFATFAHEMGHGLTAILVGGRFERFALWANGSGVAFSSGVEDGLPRALVSAGGLVGPTLLGAILFVVARWQRASRVALYLLALGLVLADVLVVRNAFGLVYVAAVAFLLGSLARKASAGTAQVALVFVAMQLCLSVFSSLDYMFSSEARLPTGTIPSDTAAMAVALGGTYWLWGFVTASLSIGAALLGILLFLHGTRGPGAASARG